MVDIEYYTMQVVLGCIIMLLHQNELSIWKMACRRFEKCPPGEVVVGASPSPDNAVLLRYASAYGIKCESLIELLSREITLSCMI